MVLVIATFADKSDVRLIVFPTLAAGTFFVGFEL
jgi:hypothetical protein